jgi:P-type Ca2+ transporter type 2C
MCDPRLMSEDPVRIYPYIQFNKEKHRLSRTLRLGIVKVMPDSAQSYYSLTKDKLFDLFQTSREGLSSQRAREALDKYGPNRLSAKKKKSALSMFLAQFKNTLTIILIISAVLILFIYQFGERETSDLVEAVLILGIVLLITVLGFIQEFKAERAIESLKKLLAFRAKVVRDGVEQEIDVVNLVPGDIVVIEEGTKVPSDIRLLEVFNLRVNEASLTGESVPVNKAAGELSENLQIADQRNMIFAGTNVASGRAIGIVVSTGDKTEIGKIARDVAEAEEGQTPIQERLDKTGKLIGFLILGICAVVFVFIFFFAGDFSELHILDKLIHSFIASVALAVAAIPEGLPAVVTISLALGTQRMLKRQALVRKLNSVETLGSVDVICSDKTGTFTKNEMTVTKIYYEGKVYDVSGTGYETKGEFSLGGQKVDPATFKRILETGLYCNNASIKDPSASSHSEDSAELSRSPGSGQAGQVSVLGDPTEGALIVSAAKAGLSKTGERVHEVPFSSERKLMTVVIKKDPSASSGQVKYFVYTKGAPETVIEKCKLSADEKKKILDANKVLSDQALRSLGFAYKELSASEFEKQKAKEDLLEEGLTFLGIQGMIDPPRVEVRPLIEECAASGIRTIMITGDNGATAKAIANEIGLEGDALTGSDLEKMSDEQFYEVIDRVSIYARVNPGVKMRIVSAFKKKGHIVAMTGDGVNDAPALKAADIGVAMGITGTDVAKEASDMVLLDDKFSTIVEAIKEGRGIYHNIRKFIRYLLSCNIAEVILIFFGVIVLQELVLTATMLLWINVVTDGIPAVALGMDEAEEGIMRYKPEVFQENIINRELWVEMITFGVMLAVGVAGIFMLDLSQGIEKAQSAAFLAIVMFELVNIYLIRSNYRTPFFSNKWLYVSVVVTVALQVIILYVPFIANLFGLVRVDFLDWVYIVAVGGLLALFYRYIQPYIDRLSKGQA